MGTDIGAHARTHPRVILSTTGKTFDHPSVKAAAGEIANDPPTSLSPHHPAGPHGTGRQRRRPWLCAPPFHPRPLLSLHVPSVLHASETPNTCAPATAPRSATKVLRYPRNCHCMARFEVRAVRRSVAVFYTIRVATSVRGSVLKFDLNKKKSDSEKFSKI
jgi:hypothetical protein